MAEKGIKSRVIDMFSIKPIDSELILESAAKTGAIVTAEEHSVIGGLGSSVAEVLVQNNCKVPVEFVGLEDCYAETGPYDQLLKKYKLDARTIAEKVEKVIENK